MNCIVTAGPTYEPLDGVRRLTNFSTGRLGVELANYLTSRGHAVTLLLGQQSTWAGERLARTVRSFGTTRDLSAHLEETAGGQVEAVFHAAAVSDFGFGKIWQRLSDTSLKEVSGGKIPTQLEGLLVELQPTPKIIGRLRQWYPQACLVGWKYEVDGDRETVLAKAERQMGECQTNACVANGPAYGLGFGLVTAPGRVEHHRAAPDLYAALEQLATGAVGGGRGPVPAST